MRRGGASLGDEFGEVVVEVLVGDVQRGLDALEDEEAYAGFAVSGRSAGAAHGLLPLDVAVGGDDHHNRPGAGLRERELARVPIVDGVTRDALRVAPLRVVPVERSDACSELEQTSCVEHENGDRGHLSRHGNLLVRKTLPFCLVPVNMVAFHPSFAIIRLH